MKTQQLINKLQLLEKMAPGGDVALELIRPSGGTIISDDITGVKLEAAVSEDNQRGDDVVVSVVSITAKTDAT